MKALIQTLRLLSYSCIAIGIIYFIGTVGASDCEIITLEQFYKQMGIAAAFIAAGVIL